MNSFIHFGDTVLEIRLHFPAVCFKTNESIKRSLKVKISLAGVLSTQKPPAVHQTYIVHRKLVSSLCICAIKRECLLRGSEKQTV